MKKTTLLTICILACLSFAKAQSNQQFEKVYQKSWLSYHTIFKALNNHEFIHYNEYSPTLDIIDTMGKVIHQIDIEKFGKQFSDFIYSSTDSSIVGLNQWFPCDLGSIDSAYLYKFNKKGNIIWKSGGMQYETFNKMFLKRFLNGYLVVREKSMNDTIPRLLLSYINEKGVVKDYPVVKLKIGYNADVEIFAGNQIIIHNGGDFFLVDTLGNVKGVLPYQSNDKLISTKANGASYYIGLPNFIIKRDSLHQQTVLNFTFDELQPRQLLHVDTTIWMLATDTKMNKWIYKYSYNLTLIDSIKCPNEFGSILSVTDSKIICKNTDTTYRNSRPLLKSYNRKTFQTYARNQLPIVTKIRIDSLKATYEEPNDKNSPYWINYSFHMYATVRNDGTSIMKSVILNSTDFEFKGWSLTCWDEGYFKQFDSLNLAIGDSIELDFDVYKSRFYYFGLNPINDTGNYVVQNFYVWCSTPNDEVKMNSMLEDTVKINIPMKILKEVGISELNHSYNITCYPNPFTDTFTLNYSSSNNELVYCKLIDGQGKLVKEFTINSNTNSLIDVENLPKGIYLLTVNSNNYDVRTLKLIRN